MASLLGKYMSVSTQTQLQGMPSENESGSSPPWWVYVLALLYHFSPRFLVELRFDDNKAHITKYIVISGIYAS
jgi:hypothetical protein